MLIFMHEERRVIPAPREKVFAVLAEPARHAELAGSGEVKRVRVSGDGRLTVGSTFESDEEIWFGKRSQKFTAVSTVRELDPPRVISWTSMPHHVRPRARRIQWWYTLVPAGDGTEVIERVEVDMGVVANVLMKVPYRRMRAPVIRDGMARTLENLERAVT